MGTEIDPTFIRVLNLSGLPVFAVTALWIWRPGTPPKPGKSVPDRIAWTVFAFGVCLMFTMGLYAAVRESDGDFRTWETIRLHTRLFLAIAAISIVGPLAVFLHQSRRSDRPTPAGKKPPGDELAEARLGPACQVVFLAFLFALWLGLSGLLVVSRGRPEAWLAAAFGRFSRPDAFQFLNGVAILFWSAHSLLLLVAIAATRYRRPDVVAVLAIGPVIASAIALLGERWQDPNWHNVVSLGSIGWGVGTLVAGGYWLLKR